MQEDVRAHRDHSEDEKKRASEQPKNKSGRHLKKHSRKIRATYDNINEMLTHSDTYIPISCPGR